MQLLLSKSLSLNCSCIILFIISRFSNCCNKDYIEKNKYDMLSGSYYLMCTLHLAHFGCFIECENRSYLQMGA